MGVELTHDVAHDPGAFLEACGRVQPQLMHGIDQPAMHRLQAVPHIRQAARHDGGKCIGEVAVAQRPGEGRFLNMTGNVIRHGNLREAAMDAPPNANIIRTSAACQLGANRASTI
jgi:hypothetical protein